jgi:hypothetical protein
MAIKKLYLHSTEKKKLMTINPVNNFNSHIDAHPQQLGSDQIGSEKDFFIAK